MWLYEDLRSIYITLQASFYDSIRAQKKPAIMLTWDTEVFEGEGPAL